MKQSARRKAVREFLKSTTLHGFKYLTSRVYADRVGWLACCGASACCAVVLCAVLRARYQAVPALLVLRDLADASRVQTVPAVAVCPAAPALADVVMQQFPKQDINTTVMMRSILTRIINGNTAQINQLQFLEGALRAENLSVPEFIFDKLRSCQDLLTKCRWQENVVSCQQLFKYEMTTWGICCVLRPNRLPEESLQWTRNLGELEKKLDLSVDCNNKSYEGCQFFTKYEGQDSVEPFILNPGSFYRAQIIFRLEYDLELDETIAAQCERYKYSRSRCRLQCMERECGCSDPFRNVTYSGRSTLPRCPISKLNCLRIEKAKSCACNPRCKKILQQLSLEGSPMSSVSLSKDPIFHNINVNRSIVIFIRVRLIDSRIFTSKPTETWITLLSSLGGVFNMFLGVGLFSALEVLYLIFVRIPNAISRPAQLHNDNVHSVAIK